jgi:hypothetical protein
LRMIAFNSARSTPVFSTINGVAKSDWTVIASVP